MKYNLDYGVPPCTCGQADVFPKVRIIINEDHGTLKVAYKGECPICKKNYHWTSTFLFEEIYYHEG